MNQNVYFIEEYIIEISKAFPCMHVSDQQFFYVLLVKNTDPTFERTDALYWAAHGGNILLILTSNYTNLYVNVSWMWVSVLNLNLKFLLILFYSYVYDT